MGVGHYRSGQGILDEEPWWVKLGLIAAMLCMVPFCWFLWHLITPEVKAERYQVVSASPDGCRAEIWVKGKEGDRLARLMDFKTRNRHIPPKFLKAIISHENSTSTRVPDHVRTPQGNCEVVRWHLLVNGSETDSVRH